METYFKSSRLHFIGTWKARIEALSARMAPSAPTPARTVRRYCLCQAGCAGASAWQQDWSALKAFLTCNCTAEAAAVNEVPSQRQAPRNSQQAAKPQGCTQAPGGRRAIMHIDMDCFFASVASLADPALRGQPLAVCHSNAQHGSGEISSANYLARGVLQGT